MKKIVLLLTVLMAGFLSVQASHVPGGNLSYECLGGNQFLLTLTIYEDQATGFITPGGTSTITITNDCGLANPTLTLNEVGGAVDVSQLCPSVSPGGGIPGNDQWTYTGIVTLPAGCDSWHFAYSSCCRDAHDNMVGTSDSYYFAADLNNAAAPCNTSPSFSAPPIPYACVGQSFCYNLGVVEPDGDSLVFSFVPAATSATATITYVGGYSGTNPYPGLSIDPTTGQVTGVLTTTGSFVVAIQVDEYVNGVLVGSVVQDFTLEVLNCTNQVIDCATSGTIGNVTGSVFQTGPTSIQMCEGVPFSFDMSFTDPDVGDSLFITSNIGTILPGSVVSYSYPNSPNANLITMTVSWTPPPGSSNSNNIFSVVITDNSCPVTGQQTIVYNIDVLGSTSASADVTICLGDSAPLAVFNGTIFDWTVLSGDPMIVGTNFSCTPCANPIASPSVTTTYEVVSDLTGSCVNRDTVTVNVVPDFTYSMTQSSTTSCLNSSLQFDITPTPAGAYTYLWSPATFLSSTSVANPTVTPTTPGNYQYAVEITSPSGCVKYDTMNITVAAAYSPNVTVTVNTDSIFCGDTVFFSTDLGGGIPAICGPSANTACSAPSSQQTIGTMIGTNTTTSWPAPYGNWYKNAKHQFLYTATELQAMGFVGGKITEIAWEVTQINGTTNYANYQISMGCTGTTSLTTWETGLTQVMTPQNIVINTGWNTHVLTTAYEWDGISNLVVQICYDLSTSYTQNSATPYTTTAFNSSLYYRSDSQPACPATLVTTSTNRPVTRFTTCPTVPDPNNFSFAWTPVASIDNAIAQNTFGVPQVTTNYQLVVTDLNGGCTDTVNVLIDVLCDTCYAPTPTLTNITCFGGNDGQIIATPNGVDGPWIIELTDATTNTLLQSVPNVTPNTTFTGLVAGDYIVRSIDTTGCFADTLVTLVEPPYVNMTLTSDTIVCIGGVGALEASATDGNGAPYIYNWTGGITSTTGPQNVTPTINTTYDVYALDPLGCSSDTLSVTVSLFPPILTTSSTDIFVCPGDAGQVSVQANGGIGGTYFYEWTDEQGNVVGAANSISVTNTYSPQTYYVSVTDNCETPATIDSVTVAWYNEPVVTFTSDTTEGCYPAMITFTNTTLPSMVGSCLWDFGDGSTSSTCGIDSNLYLVANNYTIGLTVTSPDGCVSTTTITDMITINGYPTAEFVATPNPTDVMHPDVEFTDSSTTDAITWSWTFGENGELGTSTDQNPSLIFPDAQPGTYPVELVVSNNAYCTDTSLIYVVVNGVYNFYVPSAFTPDGDGINDTFYPMGESIDAEGYELRIFNRWGSVIFFAEGMSAQWDGMYQNAPVQEGIYVWIVKTVNAVTGEFNEYTGHVALIR